MYNSVMQALQDIFGIWPSLRELADEIGEKHSTVRKWRKRKRIPDSAWHRIIEKAAVRRKLLTVEDFVRLNSKREVREVKTPRRGIAGLNA